MTSAPAASAQKWPDDFGEMPLIAILRGLEPDHAVDTIAALRDAGFRAIEIPLNSPSPLSSIERAQAAFGDSLLLGAGTVLTPEDARAVLSTGARLIVAPNTDARVAEVARDANAVYCPGAMSPTEVFQALQFGATAVKLFPAELIGPVGVKAMRAVVPAGCALFPVGGVSTSNLADYLKAGADGFGLGSALFKPGQSPEDVGRNAAAFVAAWRAANTAL